MNFHVVIIGGSFAGMTTALLLSKISPEIKIAIIEKNDLINSEKKADGRAYAISSKSLEIFDKIEINQYLKNYESFISDIKITDYKSSSILDFIGLETNKKNGILGKIIENHHIHNALRLKILEQTNITLFSPNFYKEINFDSDFAIVKLDNDQVITSKLLLACDGRKSELREIYNIKSTKKDYLQTAILFSIKTQYSHKNVAYEKFLPGGPIAILPLRNQFESSIVWIAKHKDANNILQLDQENFTHYFNKKIENCLGNVEITSDKFSYPLTLVEADKFYHKRMLLIGDASCGIHPIAGQGFNLAISGIEILRDLIEKYLSCGLDIGSSQILEQYNKKFKMVSRKMIIATDLLNSIFENEMSSIKFVRNFGMKIINDIEIVKKFFIKSAGGF